MRKPKIKNLFLQRFLGTIIILVFIKLSGWSQNKFDDKILKDALTNGISMGLPGISVGIGSGDSIVWTGTDGYRDVLAGELISSEDKFGIGSITKTFVAMTILQLVQEGKLDLDKVPTDYLDLQIVRDVPNTDKAPLKYLLNHQSGIPTWEFQPDWIREGRGADMDVNHIWSKTETLEYISKDKVKADFEPGQKYSYSNTNYTVLGLVIEAVTGNDVMVEIRKRFLQALKMDHTYLESFEDIPDGIVNHYHSATPKFIEVAGVHNSFSQISRYMVESSSANLSPEWVAGGFVTSASDLVHWAQALRKGTFLEPEMQKKFLTYYPPLEGINGGGEYLQGISRIPNFFNGKTVIGHSGGTLGFTSIMYWIEDTDVVIVCLTNLGIMHSGLKQSPFWLFTREVLFPSVIAYLKQAK